MCSCPIGFERRLLVRDSTCSLRHVMAFFLPLYLPYWWSFAFHLSYCVSNLWDLSRERKNVHKSVAAVRVPVQPPFRSLAADLRPLWCWFSSKINFGTLLVFIFFAIHVLIYDLYSISFLHFYVFRVLFPVCASVIGLLDFPWIFACLLSVFNSLTLARRSLLELCLYKLGHPWPIFPWWNEFGLPYRISGLRVLPPRLFYCQRGFEAIRGFDSCPLEVSSLS